MWQHVTNINHGVISMNTRRHQDVPCCLITLSIMTKAHITLSRNKLC
jgi:hypothetical protein